MTTESNNLTESYEGTNSKIYFKLVWSRENYAFALIWFIAGSLEAAYSLNWGAREIWGKGGGETLALLW